MNEEKQLAKREEYQPPAVSLTAGASIAELIHQREMIHELLQKVLIRGTHYDKIPGTGDKLSLLQPGAQAICTLFKLGPEIEETEKDLGDGHREIKIKVKMIHYPTGTKVAEGIGSCSTMESKYRYRNVDDFEVLDEDIPKDSKEKKAEYRKQGLGMRKVDGQWKWVRFLNTDAKVENPDIADVYNTVYKMALKRALVGGTLIATGTSDLFTQDMEGGGEKAETPVSAPSEEAPRSPRAAQARESAKSEPEQTPEPPPTWDNVGVKDMVEDVTKAGKKFYTILFNDGKKAWTFDGEMASEIHGHFFVSLKVKQHSTGSYEILGFQDADAENPTPAG